MDEGEKSGAFDSVVVGDHHGGLFGVYVVCHCSLGDRESTNQVRLFEPRIFGRGERQRLIYIR